VVDGAIPSGGVAAFENDDLRKIIRMELGSGITRMPGPSKCVTYRSEMLTRMFACPIPVSATRDVRSALL
jgi:hypothetical protein